MITTKRMLIPAFLLALILLIVKPGVAQLGGALLMSENNEVKCLPTERNALLKFKAQLIDYNRKLSSWEKESQDCCLWEGVLCDNGTNHVIALDLSGFPFQLIGQSISSSLLELVDLNHLDLSGISFDGSKIPMFIGSLGKLQYLNLSCCSFAGMIPLSLGNLSRLRFLDLNGDSWGAHSNLDWLSGLKSLEYLGLSGIDLTEAKTWPQTIHKLPMVKEIHLTECSLPRPALPTSPLHSVNVSKSLAALYLSNNRMSLASLFPWLLNYNNSLRCIALSDSNIGWGILDTLKYLRSLYHLDLNHNDLGGRIPDILRNWTNLSYLDLSGNGIGGSIPNSLGNLSSLSHLDFSWNRFSGSIPNTLGSLSSLSHLDLSFNQLQGKFSDQRFDSLTYLDLCNNKLQGELARLMVQVWNSSFLQHLDLSENLLFGSLPDMSRFPYLKKLGLAGNRLNGSIGQQNFKLSKLEFLDVSRNSLTGRFPILSSCLSLREMSVANNMLSGTLPESIGNLFRLEKLDLGSNHLEGLISEVHMFNLSNLQLLDLSFNKNFTVKISSSWDPPFQLNILVLASCNVGPHFPRWLKNQTMIQHLEIFNANISDTIPSWFWHNLNLTNYLNMSHNQLHGVLPDLSALFFLNALDLSFNQLNGSVPSLPLSCVDIILSKNKFSGINSCEFSYYSALDLSDNLLAGSISPGCFKNLTHLGYLNLAHNNLSGNIPTEYCHLSALYLRNNSFTGHIPRFLMTCYNMIALDLGENHFYGNIPEWLAGSMRFLVVLSLKSNNLSGSLPSSLCSLTRLQVLDMSMNRISNTIPNCVNNFTVLSSEAEWAETLNWTLYSNWTRSRNSVNIMWKGRIEEYINSLWLLKFIDLSSNNFSGEIPHEVTNLVGLFGLNLSWNNLVGSIPRDIGQLELLNFLDLSGNNISGSIPPTLSQLSHLGVLNLSFNNLSGKIPLDTHMDTFGASAYAGNPGLCGLPLVSKPCPEHGMPKKTNQIETEIAREGMLESREFYVSGAIGFGVSFLGLCWTLFFSKKWNVATHRMFIGVGDWLYVNILASKRRWQSAEELPER